jgi:hypothetical protein
VTSHIILFYDGWLAHGWRGKVSAVVLIKFSRVSQKHIKLNKKPAQTSIDPFTGKIHQRPTRLKNKS